MDENKTEENKNNLISIGKGIILSSPNNNTLPTPRERKSRREEAMNIKTIKSYNSITISYIKLFHKSNYYIFKIFGFFIFYLRIKKL